VVTARPLGACTIEEMLAAARSRLLRLTPPEAFRECSEGGMLIDIRPASQRAVDGEVPGSAVVERNHLEWRLDPCCDARLPWVTGYHHRIIVICQEGYTSSLAAAALQDLGLHRATDVVGGFRAWTELGLPSAPGGAGTVTLAPGAASALLSRSPPGRLLGPAFPRRSFLAPQSSPGRGPLARGGAGSGVLLPGLLGVGVQLGEAVPG
jgi:rhodanese-related sulfurtransferase